MRGRDDAPPPRAGPAGSRPRTGLGVQMSYLSWRDPRFRVIGWALVPTHPSHRRCAGCRAGSPPGRPSAFEDEGPAQAMLAASPHAAPISRSDRRAPSLFGRPEHLLGSPRPPTRRSLLSSARFRRPPPHARPSDSDPRDPNAYGSSLFGPAATPHAAGSFLWFSARSPARVLAAPRRGRALRVSSRFEVALFHDRLGALVRLIPRRCRATPRLPPSPTSLRRSLSTRSTATPGRGPQAKAFLFGHPHAASSSIPSPPAPAAHGRPSRPQPHPPLDERDREPRAPSPSPR
jgi:hypothetical protein